MATNNESSTGEVFWVYTPREYVANSEKHTEWLRIGRAWPNKRAGFNLQLWVQPLPVDGNVSIHIFKHEPRSDDAT